MLMPSVVMLSVPIKSIMQNVIMLIVIMLNVVAPKHSSLFCKKSVRDKE
jgi:hypothetical protein